MTPILFVLLTTCIVTTTTAQPMYQWEELAEAGNAMPPISTIGSANPAVALAGDDDILFGIPDFSNELQSEGIVNVFTETYTLGENLTSPAESSTTEQFGSTIAVSDRNLEDGDSIALIGAPNSTISGGLVGAGRVYVHIKSGSGDGKYLFKEVLTGSVPTVDAAFGHAIGHIPTVSSEYIFSVGAPNDTNAESTRTGAAYLASYDGGSFTLMDGGVIFGDAGGDQFGYSVVGDFAAGGDTASVLIGQYAAIGAPGGDYVKIYELNIESFSPIWEQIQVGLVQGTGAEMCGQSLAMSGLHLAVGCPGANAIRVYNVNTGVQVGSDITGEGYGMKNRIKLVGKCFESSNLRCALFAGASDGTIHAYMLLSEGLNWEEINFGKDGDLKLDVVDGVYAMDAGMVESGNNVSTRVVIGQQAALRAFDMVSTAPPAPAPTTMDTPTSGASFSGMKNIFVGFFSIIFGASLFVV